MEHYVAGWDGGGTKTAMQVRNIDGKVLLNTETGGLNYNSNTEDELGVVIHTLIDKMSKLPGGLGAYRMLCISTAGISNLQAIEFLQRNIREAGVTCEIKIVGDHEGALYGALGKTEGLVLNSGTGSICFGRNHQQRMFRAGGWGHLIDDEGSGYAIGRDILSAAVQSYDKRIPVSILYDMVLDKIQGSSVEDIINYTYKIATGKKDIASLAPLLIDAIHQKDQQAIMIADKAAKALERLVIPVVEELNLEYSELAFTGGILTHYEAIREKVENQIRKRYPKLKIIEAKHDSVSGITHMALEFMKRRD